MITKSEFVTPLIIELVKGDEIWQVKDPLIYHSVYLDRAICVPPDFYTDLASVPRVPIIYEKWGNKAHMEAVLHDYLYCIDSEPVVTFEQANYIFWEAMGARDKPADIKNGMYRGVALGGQSHFHKRLVNYNPIKEVLL